MGRKWTWGQAIGCLLTALLLIAVLHPFLWLVVAAFKPENEFMKYPPTVFASSYGFDSFIRVWDTIPLVAFFRNTIIFSAGVMAISVLLDSMAGYAFARLRFKGNKTLFTLVLITMMVPFQVLMIPLFVEVFKLGMLDTYWGLIIPRAASAFGIYLMRSFFISLPKDLEESGRVDGFNEFQIYWRLMLPLCKPVMITLGIFHLMNNWNDLLYPLMLTSSTEMRTLSAGLAMFVGQRNIEYGPTLAASLLALLPLLIVYVFAQRFFVQGVATSGMKG
ncbi:carbohydrate ABC transporter permease [Cohnella fermenti]|uniref:Carbohydrate ABC transporter permease n=1 Tax=Cohnella fermenti TaxID=2565925 RepID=A0A4S4BFL3_9BACL|nr:carbohydrate ABC transporter permease [Cohnella fermenti]THF72880.1 carbohydrate ABC transporter permease [Cohnella fermenti]